MKDSDAASKPSAPKMPTSAAYADERNKVPPELWSAYDALVADYRHFAFVHHSQPFVSYKVLASLALAGWRIDPRSAERSEAKE